VKRDWLALAFAMTFPSVMSWVYFVALAGEGGQPGPAVSAVYGAGKTLQFAFPLLYVWWFERERLRPAAPCAGGLGLAVLFALLVSAGMFALYFAWLKHSPLAADTPRLIVGKLKDFGLTTPLSYLGMALFISVAHSLLEEYYFRWFIFVLLKRYLSLWPAILVSALAFMGHHVVVLGVYFPGVVPLLTVVLPFSLCVAAGGAAWAWLYHRSGSLYAPWLSHFLIDVTIMAIGYDLVRPYLET
jgi:membrane protease YdiL (CAAX protease family)